MDEAAATAITVIGRMGTTLERIGITSALEYIEGMLINVRMAGGKRIGEADTQQKLLQASCRIKTEGRRATPHSLMITALLAADPGSRGEAHHDQAN